MADMMPREQSEFINGLQDRSLKCFNMTEDEAYEFAFRIWQGQDFIHRYLDENGDRAKRTLHLLVTTICNRDCQYCCNKQYNLNDISYASDKDFFSVGTVCITGGEPFAYSNPDNIARRIKGKYPHIKKVIVYSNAAELADYLDTGGQVNHIDGVSVSIKNNYDRVRFGEAIIKHEDALRKLTSNRLYTFPGFENMRHPVWIKQVNREWQEKFEPAPNCIFRKL